MLFLAETVTIARVRTGKDVFFKRPEIRFEAREDSKLMAVMVANAKIFLHSFTFRKEGYK